MSQRKQNEECPREKSIYKDLKTKERYNGIWNTEEEWREVILG